ncbi:MAG: aspartate-semialdehyde dehydrogenase [Thermoanaerobacteraceae bacterium]|nr:aspartate-semialdehyde dehydrogenase [Thermoanaerobacteraceae bacterium]MDN5301048.1 aspartate-semialdehyde dehydrogenase [Thermoanaerobacteraceae bacterium]MDN5311598.1 aspartate-semialdehyde dehydrogenase [Thermoanaerobacteraceae bacterium]RKL63981.1 aspartate-semialdehyde dehydrogenase [Thermoanaerobacteraceae bacterium SP2]
MKSYNVAVVGATGAVGQTMIKILQERNFPVKRILPLASARSNGHSVEFRGEKIKVEEAMPSAFEGIDIALFSAGNEVSMELAPEAVKRGAVVIDNSSAFRMAPEVPLVVPEVNPGDIHRHKGLIANPNCSTIQMVVVLKPIHEKARIKRVVVSTYQAVSGTGVDAIEELKLQSRKILSGDKPEPRVYPYPIAFNVLPHIDVFDDTGYSMEEWKMVRETKKIMGDESIAVTATTVRVPVFNCHSEAVNIETVEKLTADGARSILSQAPGVKVVDDPQKRIYPLPKDVSGQNDVFVGRIREDFSIPCGLNLWIVADNLRKGAAYNAVQIAEYMVEHSLI